MATKKPQPKKAPQAGKRGATPAPAKTVAKKRAPAKTSTAKLIAGLEKVAAATSERVAKRKTGRPALHTPQLAAAVCTALMGGKTLRQIEAMPGMPSSDTILRWLHDDTDGFCGQYARARQVQAELEADEIRLIADTPLLAVKRTIKGKGKNREIEDVHTDAVERSRLMVDARKWRASKMHPKRFGDHLNVDGQAELLVTVRDLTGRKGEAPPQAGGPGQ